MGIEISPIEILAPDSGVVTILVMGLHTIRAILDNKMESPKNRTKLIIAGAPIIHATRNFWIRYPTIKKMQKVKGNTRRGSTPVKK